MRKYEYRRKYIDGARFGYYMVQKIKWLIIATLVIMVLAIGVGYGKDVKNKKNHDKKYPDNQIQKSISLKSDEIAKAQQYYESKKKLKSCQDYINNSPYMKIDYNNVTSRNIRYNLINGENTSANQDYQKLLTNLNSDSVVQEIAEKLGMTNINISYIRELFNIDSSQKDILNIYISVENEEYANIIGDTLKKIVQSYSINNMVESLDRTITTRIGSVRDTQQTYLNQQGTLVTTIEKLDKELSSSQKSYLEKYDNEIAKGNNITFGEKITYYQKTIATVSLKKDIKNGIMKAIEFLFAMIVILFIVYTVTPYVWSGKSVKDSIGLEYLGRIKSSGNKDDRDRIRFLLEKGQYIVLSHDSSVDKVFEFIENAKCITVEELLAGKHKIEDNHKIVMAERAGKVTYNALDEELVLLYKYQDYILGYVSIE